MEPDTIVLVHGFWVTPRSWENWITHYEAKGYRVLAPGYPGFEVEVEALSADPQIIVDVTVPAIIEQIEAVIRELDKPPIIIGHSAGGAFTQVLLDHGFGAAGVALNSAPTEGVRVVPLSQVKSTFPVLKSPANRHKAVGLSLEQWKYAFTNTFTDEESQGALRALPHPGERRHPLGQRAGQLPAGPAGHRVDYHNDDRAPLLFVSGSEDHIMPPAVQQSNAKHYKSDTITEIKEYEGYAHLLPAQEGWEQIADEVLDWAVEHARDREVQPHPHRRADRPDRGRRLAAAHRPDLRPRRRALRLRLGHVVGQGHRAGGRGRRPAADRRRTPHPRPPRRQPRQRRPGAAVVRRRSW